MKSKFVNISKKGKNMGMGSFILGIGVGVILTFALILVYIVNTFGWDFIPILLSVADGKVSYGDIMNMARFFGYI